MLPNCLHLLIFLCVSFRYAQPTHVKDDHYFDLLIFTQQWPPTECKIWKDESPSHTCTMPSKQDEWTIHGIWPTKLGTMGPAFCNRSWHFDAEKIRPIETPLIQLWTNIQSGPNKYALWAHEWNKHGTCAAVLDPLNSELNYFSKGLDWVQKYSMSSILKEADIVPSNEKEYSIAEIHDAINIRLGVNPVIECRKEKGKNWLIELRICFNKSLELADCDGVLGIEAKDVVYQGDMIFSVLTNCDTSQNVVYPHDSDLSASPQKLYVQLYKLISWLQWFTL